MKRHSVPVNFTIRFPDAIAAATDIHNLPNTPSPTPPDSAGSRNNSVSDIQNADPPDSHSRPEPEPATPEEPPPSYMEARRLSEIQEVQSRPPSSVRRPESGVGYVRQLSGSRPTTSSHRRFEDIPEVHLTTQFSMENERAASRRNSSQLHPIAEVDSTSTFGGARPRTTSAYVRSYSSSSFESIQEDTEDSSSNWDSSYDGDDDDGAVADADGEDQEEEDEVFYEETSSTKRATTS